MLIQVLGKTIINMFNLLQLRDLSRWMIKGNMKKQGDWKIVLIKLEKIIQRNYNQIQLKKDN